MHKVTEITMDLKYYCYALIHSELRTHILALFLLYETYKVAAESNSQIEIDNRNKNVNNNAYK